MEPIVGLSIHLEYNRWRYAIARGSDEYREWEADFRDFDTAFECIWAALEELVV